MANLTIQIIFYPFQFLIGAKCNRVLLYKFLKRQFAIVFSLYKFLKRQISIVFCSANFSKSKIQSSFALQIFEETNFNRVFAHNTFEETDCNWVGFPENISVTDRRWSLQDIHPSLPDFKSILMICFKIVWLFLMKLWLSKRRMNGILARVYWSNDDCISKLVQVLYLLRFVRSER